MEAATEEREPLLLSRVSSTLKGLCEWLLESCLGENPTVHDIALGHVMMYSKQYPTACMHARMHMCQTHDQFSLVCSPCRRHRQEICQGTSDFGTKPARLLVDVEQCRDSRSQ